MATITGPNARKKMPRPKADLLPSGACTNRAPHEWRSARVSAGMPERQDDPAAALLAKIGRVLRIAAVVAVVVAQVPQFTSGELINVVAGLLNIGFVVWLAF